MPLSGITLTFRDKEYFKKEVFIEKIIEKNLKELPPPGRGVKNVEYNKTTGELKYIQMQPPKILGMIEKMHKATSSTAFILFKCIFWSRITLFCVFIVLDVSTTNRYFQKSNLLHTWGYCAFFANDFNIISTTLIQIN